MQGYRVWARPVHELFGQVEMVLDNRFKCTHRVCGFNLCMLASVPLREQESSCILQREMEWTVEPFFADLTEAHHNSILAVGIDLSKALQSARGEVFAGGRGRYDKLHIVANYDKVIDRLKS